MPSLCETIEIIDEVPTGKGTIVNTQEAVPSQTSTPTPIPQPTSAAGNTTPNGTKRKIIPVSDEKTPRTMDDDNTDKNITKAKKSNKRSKLSNDGKSTKSNSTVNTEQKKQRTLASFFTAAKRTGVPKSKPAVTSCDKSKNKSASQGAKVKPFSDATTAKATSTATATATDTNTTNTKQPKDQENQSQQTKKQSGGKSETTHKEKKTKSNTTKTTLVAPSIKATSKKTITKAAKNKSKSLHEKKLRDAALGRAKSLQNQHVRDAVLGRIKTFEDLPEEEEPNHQDEKEEQNTGGKTTKKKYRASSQYELPEIPFSTSNCTMPSNSKTVEKEGKDQKSDNTSLSSNNDQNSVRVNDDDANLSCQLVHKFDASVARSSSEHLVETENVSSSKPEETSRINNEKVLEIDTNTKQKIESLATSKNNVHSCTDDNVIMIDCAENSPIKLEGEKMKAYASQEKNNETETSDVNPSVIVIDSGSQGKTAIDVGPKLVTDTIGKVRIFGNSKDKDNKDSKKGEKNDVKGLKAVDQRARKKDNVTNTEDTKLDTVVVDSETQGAIAMDVTRSTVKENKEGVSTQGTNEECSSNSTPFKVNDNAKSSLVIKKGVQKSICVKGAVQDTTASSDREMDSGDDVLVPTKEVHENAPSKVNESKVLPTTEKTDMSTEDLTLLKKHQSLRETYCCRVNELIRSCRAGLEDEDFVITIPSTDGLVSSDALDSDTFPDFAVPHLAAAIEGSHLSLSKLGKQTSDKLNEAFGHSSFTTDCVLSKVKVLATRKNYVKNPHMGTGTKILKTNKIDLFQDENQDHMWRWEVISLDILPPAFVAKVKKARTSRKKISSQINAITRLLMSLEESINILNSIPKEKSKLDKLLIKVSQEEERVLKFEREAEKARLAVEAKKKKEEDKERRAREAKEQGEEKERLAEERKKEKQRIIEMKKKEKQRLLEEKKKEKERKKEEAENLKRKKLLEREEQRRKEMETKQAALKKQKACLISFFSSGTAKKKKSKPTSPISSPKNPGPDHPMRTFNVEQFRASIGSDDGSVSRGPLFPCLSASAVASRKRRSRRVSLSVFVTVMPSEADPFGVQPYAEEKEVEVVSKYKFLQFHEDCRPPYHGTWSKKSSVVTGKNPFGRDTAHLDYDVDSEAEWEEGDDEVGFDVNEDAADDEDENMDDEGDPQQYNYQDDWLTADDDLGNDEDVDEETKILRKKKLQSGSDGDRTRKYGQVPCIIAPGQFGVPLDEILPLADMNASSAWRGRIEGFGVQDAQKLLSSHVGEVLCDNKVFLDAFPPPFVEEGEYIPGGNPSSSGNQGPGRPSNPVSQGDLKTLATFIHHCTLTSKPKVVEEFKKKYPSTNISLNHCYRTLDAIAEKKRHPQNGEYYWEVKATDLDDFGLTELKDKSFQPNPDVDFTNGQDVLKGDILKAFAKFLHHSTLSSKDKIVVEFQSAYPALASNRALILRTLQTVAEKRKQLNDNKVYWEVKKNILIELDLEDLVKPFPEVTKDESTDNDIKGKKNKKTDDKGKRSKKSEVSNSSGEVAGTDDTSGNSSSKKNQLDPTTGGKKRKRAPVSAVSAASANLLAQFLTKKKTSSTAG